MSRSTCRFSAGSPQTFTFTALMALIFVQHGGVVEGRLDVTLSFVVGEEESPVFHDGPTQGGAKLVLTELVETPGRQGAGSVQSVVAEELIERNRADCWSRSW